eukprot:COSAG05_NODE_15265_length_374_cov_0.458182_1_plen_21_part_10
MREGASRGKKVHLLRHDSVTD